MTNDHQKGVKLFHGISSKSFSLELDYCHLHFYKYCIDTYDEWSIKVSLPPMNPRLSLGGLLTDTGGSFPEFDSKLLL